MTDQVGQGGASTGDEVLDALRVALPGTRSGRQAGPRVQADVDLSAFTTLKVGGPARYLAWPDTLEELQAIAATAAAVDLRWTVVGKGSNLLVADAGFDGIVIVLGRGFRGVEQAEDSTVVRLGAAEPMPVLAVTLQRLGLGGMAFAVAIPGTVGGAVRMNAGAHGGEMVDVLLDADVVRMDGGEVQTLTRDQLVMGYRRTALPADAVVISARVQLAHTDDVTLAAAMEDMREWRRTHQPLNEPSCGSTFTNPPGDSAGRLIDAAGLKGYAVGGARISERHANFISVTPGAAAEDVHDVLRHAQREVHRIHDVLLHPEVVVLGRFERSTAEISTTHTSTTHTSTTETRAAETGADDGQEEVR